MNLIRTLDRSRRCEDALALTIGNFDGIHLGHQSLIKSVVDHAPGLTPALMCFEPLPMTLFRPQSPVPRLMGVRDRARICQALGIQRLFMPRFDRAFASMSPEDFVSKLVVGAAAARHVVVGHDFRFGHKAAGDVPLLVSLGKKHGFSVEVVDPVCRVGDKISSSRIRQLLAQGFLDRAAVLLGRSYSLSGRVLHGQKLGRTLGFPTANIRPPLPPALQGVFAVRVSGCGLSGLPGMANLGCRPTVNGRAWLLEVHLFDYDGDLYGQHLNVEFLHRLRGEEKFDGLDAMTAQLARDADLARQLLGSDAVTA
ncbi:MAG TPA: bifunctional riboflavin kinase/FAD synthetase [Wenzhouxiangella sp.]|nr:bifunctional riboflavin kinase/FAD synthetase [Wenzhouxiangella sp.]